ncbi:hypothetical protein Tco_0620152 [Tanacetum coccineum]
MMPTTTTTTAAAAATTTTTTRKFAVKLVGYFDDSDVDLVSSVEEYLILVILLMAPNSLLPNRIGVDIINIEEFASGAKLCDELRVIDVDSPAGSGIRSFKTCEGNKLSSLEVKCKTNPIPLRHKSNVKEIVK